LRTVLHIVGNRPQFIKLVVLYRELAMAGVPQEIIHTGQHSSDEMSGIFFSELQIPAPGVQLYLPAAANGDFTGVATAALQDQFREKKDHVVFVYGDTNTTAAGAMAASAASLPLVHFEAGIRTGDDEMPEEKNRRLADRLAQVNYCCTDDNMRILLAEGGNSRIVLTGDLMYDAFLHVGTEATFATNEKEYICCTIHRAENIQSETNLRAVVEALNAIHQEMPVLMPVHPHTKKKMTEFGLKLSFTQLPPLGYAAMRGLLMGSSFVITDSGGAAREAFFAHKRSVVVMARPFWPEISAAGCSISTAAGHSQIVRAFDQLPNLSANFQTPIFGNGNAAAIIKNDLVSWLG
jgi:UDP-GlcNAc3NAcA epimerase